MTGGTSPPEKAPFRGSTLCSARKKIVQGNFPNVAVLWENEDRVTYHVSCIMYHVSCTMYQFRGPWCLICTPRSDGQCGGEGEGEGEGEGGARACEDSEGSVPIGPLYLYSTRHYSHARTVESSNLGNNKSKFQFLGIFLRECVCAFSPFFILAIFRIKGESDEVAGSKVLSRASWLADAYFTPQSHFRLLHVCYTGFFCHLTLRFAIVFSCHRAGSNSAFKHP